MRRVRLVVLRVPVGDAELAADRLWGAGARAVEERDVGGGRFELASVIGDDEAVVAGRLGDLPSGWTYRFEEVDAAPAESWRDHVTAIEVGADLVLRPAWLPGLGRPGSIDIAIEPGDAFGLGDHPTTRLTAAAVRRLVRPGDDVLDVGCGSGVLAVVAARLGARAVTAIDVAEAARSATIDNARRNAVAARIDASTTPLELIDGTFDLVLANILAPVLIAMAPHLRSRTAATGRLVVSGVLDGHHDHVLEALAPMRAVATDRLDGWAAIELAHP
jgi:ribosomal protein L11 methyltransferase